MVDVGADLPDKAEWMLNRYDAAVLGCWRGGEHRARYAELRAEVEAGLRAGLAALAVEPPPAAAALCPCSCHDCCVPDGEACADCQEFHE